MDIQTLNTAQQIATRGSPVVLEAAGRLLGLGQQEQQQLLGGQIPTWAWVLGGMVAGWVLGGVAQRRGWAPGWLSSK